MHVMPSMVGISKSSNMHDRGVAVSSAVQKVVCSRKLRQSRPWLAVWTLQPARRSCVGEDALVNHVVLDHEDVHGIVAISDADFDRVRAGRRIGSGLCFRRNGRRVLVDC